MPRGSNPSARLSNRSGQVRQRFGAGSTVGAPEGLRKAFGRRVVTSVVTVVYEGFGLGPWVTGSLELLV